MFSRESFAWECLDRERIFVIAPSIDVFSPKNEDLDRETVLAVLRASGLLSDGGREEHSTFSRQDATPSRVDRPAEVIEDEPLDASTPVVLQVSRWDVLKDPLGVIRGFAQHVPESTGSHLLYAGPAVTAVADDPEGLKVLREAQGAPRKPPRRAAPANPPRILADG